MYVVYRCLTVIVFGGKLAGVSALIGTLKYFCHRLRSISIHFPLSGEGQHLPSDVQAEMNLLLTIIGAWLPVSLNSPPRNMGTYVTSHWSNGAMFCCYVSHDYSTRLLIASSGPTPTSAGFESRPIGSHIYWYKWPFRRHR